jgi:hypothetical protein
MLVETKATYIELVSCTVDCKKIGYTCFQNFRVQLFFVVLNQGCN